MKNSKKIYLKAYTRINLGDDLFIHIICARYPDTTFYLKESKPYTDIFNSIPNLIITENIDDISFDAIVYIGGSIFIENSPSSISRVRDLKEEIIKENIPTYIIGANFGPYTSNEYFNVVKNELLPHLESITFRDTYSYNLFKDMSNVYYAPDVVFSLEYNTITKIRRKEIGISVIHHLEREQLKQNYNEYICKLVEIAKYYISIGYTVNLFSFCNYEKDMLAINDITNKLSDLEQNNIKIYDYNGNVSEALKELSNLELLIATRFHSMILGIKLNIPTIPICYSNKVLNVLNDINFGKNNIYDFKNIKDLNYKNIPTKFYSNELDRGVEQFKQLDKFIKISETC